MIAQLNCICLKTRLYIYLEHHEEVANSSLARDLIESKASLQSAGKSSRRDVLQRKLDHCVESRSFSSGSGCSHGVRFPQQQHQHCSSSTLHFSSQPRARFWLFGSSCTLLLTLSLVLVHSLLNCYSFRLIPHNSFLFKCDVQQSSAEL